MSHHPHFTMGNNVQLTVDLPEEVLNRIESRILLAIDKALSSRTSEIQNKPRKLTRAEAAAKLRCSLPTLDSYTKQGRIKAQRIGRPLLYDEAEIERYLSSNRT